jgi:glucose/arabinose dehydrogenase
MYPQIESFGNTTFVVWQDNSTGNEEIFVSKSDNGGITFGNIINLSNNNASSMYPQIESFGNTTFVVWQDNSKGNEEIFVSKSVNGAIKFSGKKNLSNNNASSMYPQIESFGNTTFVVWQDNSTGNEEIFLRKSNDGDNKFYDPKNIPESNVQYKGGPIMNDPNLIVELVATGFEFPTSMAFLGPNDILVLEKNEGLVKRVVNGSILVDPLLDVNVANVRERGMLGIATTNQEIKDKDKPVYVFLYYTETKSRDGEDLKGGDPLGNRLYRFELIKNKLVNQKLLLDLPSTPSSIHNGGKILVGPDNNIYLTIGDINRNYKKSSNSTITKSLNYEDGLDADGRAGILRVTQNGEAVHGGILGHGHPLDKYFAYGIRNSFGIGFDPVTGKLWDTESGPNFGDEINLVEPGFNSGWNKIQGIWRVNEDSARNVISDTTGLFNYNNTGNYSNPEFTWYESSTGPTGIIFLDSDKLGKKYANDLFVSGFHDGNIYNFKLDSNRTGLLLESPLADKVANDKNETQGITFALSYSKPLNGTIFRILPK